jgi:transcription elongation factor Elf1
MGKIKDIFNNLFGLNKNKESEDDGHLRCPTCNFEKWIEGPSGGGSVNLMCGECHSKYNYMGPFGLQELEVNKDYKKSIDRNKKIDQLLK